MSDPTGQKIFAQGEYGRELRADTLVLGSIVIIEKPGKPLGLTAEVVATDPRCPAFRVGTNGLILFAQEDGKLRDDSGAHIQVYEYRPRGRD